MSQCWTGTVSLHQEDSMTSSRFLRKFLLESGAEALRINTSISHILKDQRARGRGLFTYPKVFAMCFLTWKRCQCWMTPMSSKWNFGTLHGDISHCQSAAASRLLYRVTVSTCSLCMQREERPAMLYSGPTLV